MEKNLTFFFLAKHLKEIVSNLDNTNDFVLVSCEVRTGILNGGQRVGVIYVEGEGFVKPEIGQAQSNGIKRVGCPVPPCVASLNGQIDENCFDEVNEILTTYTESEAFRNSFNIG